MKNALNIVFYSVLAIIAFMGLFIPTRSHYEIISDNGKTMSVRYYPPLSKFTSEDTIVKCDSLFYGKVDVLKYSMGQYYAKITADNNTFIYNKKLDYYIVASNMKDDSTILMVKRYWPIFKYDIKDKYKGQKIY